MNGKNGEDKIIRNKALKVAKASYGGKTNRTPEGFKKNKALSDRRSKVYEDADGNAFIGYKGTTPGAKSSWSDYWADTAIAFGLQKFNPRFREASNKFKKVQAYYKTKVKKAPKFTFRAIA